MKAPVLALAAMAAIAALVGFAPPPQTAASSSPSTRAFARGGKVVLDLAAGAYNIKGTDGDTIGVRWTARNGSDASRVRADVSVKGASARITTHGPHKNVQFYIELPERTDLDLNLTAGEVKVHGVEGNKTLSMWAGDVTIETGPAELYRRIHASVRFGDINARPFGGSKGGVLRSFNWAGAGKYTIDARLFAGDLKLTR